MTTTELPTPIDPWQTHERNHAGETCYRSAAILRIADITYRQLDHWVAAGNGNLRLFTFDEVELIYVAAGLIRAGYVVADAFRIAHNLITDGTYERQITAVHRLTITLATT